MTTAVQGDAVHSAYEAAMQRALELASNGPARGVNPQVGCVLLDAAGEIVAEGWHRGAGTPHAEVDALSKVADATGLTAVVTLEPCNHTGRTGPCGVALLEAGVARVVYAGIRSGRRVGGGAQRLRAGRRRRRVGASCRRGRAHSSTRGSRRRDSVART